MSPQETDEKNRIIAKFKGWFEEGATGSWYVIDGCGKYVAFSTYKEPYRDLPFHRSWEYLMDVVEQVENTKIEKVFYSEIIMLNGTNVGIYAHGWDDGKILFQSVMTNNKDVTTKKEAIWLAVVEFIKWYNTQTSK